MIIDLILDRKDEEKETGVDSYSASDFYRSVVQYGKVGWDITSAMDYGTEEDVKKALCAHIDDNGYNPKIKKYINSKEWLVEPYVE